MTKFAKQNIPWNKGKKMSEEMKLRISLTLKRKGIKPKVHFQASGSDNPAWKGDGASYSAIHYWIERQLGKPSMCSDCGTTESKKFEWANISEEYRRDINDFKRLCAKCHKRFDNVGQRGWQTRRQNI